MIGHPFPADRVYILYATLAHQDNCRTAIILMNENIERFIIDYHLNDANYHAPSSSFVITFHMRWLNLFLKMLEKQKVRMGIINEKRQPLYGCIMIRLNDSVLYILCSHFKNFFFFCGGGRGVGGFGVGWVWDFCLEKWRKMELGLMVIQNWEQ